jgi:hypothetical protein
LESGTGNAHTGGGTRLPIKDVIRLASHAHHYLRIYDGAKELALYHSKRLASPGQRIVLYAGDREGNALLPARWCRRMIPACHWSHRARSYTPVIPGADSPADDSIVPLCAPSSDEPNHP